MRELKFLYALALLTIVLASITACAQSPTRKASINVENILPNGRSLSANYLSGRFAQGQQDWHAAQNYMAAVLERDHNNDTLEQRTFLLTLGAGQFDKAKTLAEHVAAGTENADLARIFLACDSIRQKDYANALTLLNKLPANGFGQYTKPLLSFWALVGAGKKQEAAAMLTQHAGKNDPTYEIHMGLMEEMTGDMNAAADHYKNAMSLGLELHTASMIAHFFIRYGQPEIADKIYKGLDEAYPFNPFIRNLSAHKKDAPMNPNITAPTDGAALALFDLATLLYSKKSYDSAQIYGSMVQFLNPQSPYANLMMGDLAALHEQYSKAISYYDAMDKSAPVYWLSRLRVAEIYEISGNLEQSITMLSDMTKTPDAKLDAYVALGDIYRRHQQFDKAVLAYNEALSTVHTLSTEHWPIVYARALAFERSNRWDLAEKDLLTALTFQPKNPMVLNFLAYNWANQGVNLDKALEYAKLAATLRPDDGYIVDSYGWALFRLGQYKEAIVQLERAVALIPNDPTLLDHLGDAYWQSGRYDEARFKWKHSKDMSENDSFKSLVEQKIRDGIAPATKTAHKQAQL